MKTVQGTIEQLRARAGANWGLVNRPGKLEELQLPSDPIKGMSVSYGCRAVRVRLMEGRNWVASIDLPAINLTKDHIVRFDRFAGPHFATTEAACSISS